MEKSKSQIRQVKLGDLTFENPFTNELRGDEELTNSRRQVHNAYYSRVLPTPTAAPLGYMLVLFRVAVAHQEIPEALAAVSTQPELDGTASKEMLPNLCAGHDPRGAGRSIDRTRT